ncbi:alpha/beta fold hydrolase [Nonomuraea mesophila]|uniref:Alpha/beta fold hydrolase n=1 Tax=Nonomuraea mesophila TaxID=2530382 RepID=A0A4R5FEM5_9ACTN|nr:alpha/beta fold hydrolase [Nonomuraea mesophila]TDE48008.1 alpha/beta fold hydrolase [Nonomuraea mesophila]
MPGSVPRFPEYPFVSRWFARDGLRQHYLDEGDGAPVLMLHGNPSWSYLWRRLIVALRGEHRCVAPDHIGMGLSDKPGRGRYPYTLAARVDDLDALTSHLVAERGVPDRGWTLVMHDWGGPIGMAWADRHPGRVARLVVLNTAAFPNPYGPRVRPALRLPLWLLRETRLGERLFLRHHAFARLATSAPFGLRRRLPREVRAAFLAPDDQPGSKPGDQPGGRHGDQHSDQHSDQLGGREGHRVAVQRFVHDIPFGPGDRSWPLLVRAGESLAAFAERPVLIGWGWRDPVFDPVMLREWRRRLPGAEVHVYRDAGHYVLEDAHERLVPAVHAFLRR